MADTKTTLSAALAKLPDNTTNDISPQDHRDALVTVAPGHGEISITATAATTISDTTSYFMANGTYELSAEAMDWDMATNGQLRYTGAPERLCHIAASFSFTTASSNQTCEIVVAKNGTAIATSAVRRKTGVGSDVGSSAAHAFTRVSNGDYLTLAVRNTTSASNATFQTVNLFVMDMPVNT